MRKQHEMLHIAYGPELNQEFMRRLCPTAKYIGKSEMKDYRLRFRGIIFHSNTF